MRNLIFSNVISWRDLYCLHGRANKRTSKQLSNEFRWPFPTHFDEHRQTPKILNKPNARTKPIAQNCQESGGRNENLF